MSVMAVNSAGTYVELPPPAYTSYSSVSEELVVANRNTLGNMIKRRINVKMTIKAEWNYVTASQKNTIISLTDANEFQLRYVSMMDDEVHYGQFYRDANLEIKGFGRYSPSTRTFQYYTIKAAFTEL